MLTLTHIVHGEQSLWTAWTLGSNCGRERVPKTSCERRYSRAAARRRSERRAFFPLEATTTAADSRGSRRRSAGGAGGTTFFRSASPDEDSGNLTNIAASGASN
jgi:hypothetical protein